MNDTQHLREDQWESYCPLNTASGQALHKRFKRWANKDVWQMIFNTLAGRRDSLKIQLEYSSIF